MNLLPGQIDAHRSVVRLDDGQEVPVAGRLPTAMHGRVVQVGLRPEQMTLCDPARATLRAEFDMTEEMGAAQLCLLKIEDLP